MNAPYGQHHFFLLSKGYIAGKPLEKPCPNCFTVMTESETDKGKLFWVCYSLWKAGRYVPFLVGSVIPFLHIRDLKQEITSAIDLLNGKPREFEKLVNNLQTLHRLERQLELQAKLITRTKGELVCAFLRR